MKNTKISRRSFLLACFVCFHRPGAPCFLGCQ